MKLSSHETLHRSYTSTAGSSRVALLKPSPSDLFLPCKDPYVTLGTLGVCRTQFENDWVKGENAAYSITVCTQEKMADRRSSNSSVWRSFHWTRAQRDRGSVEEFPESIRASGRTGQGGRWGQAENQFSGSKIMSYILSPVSWLKCWPQTIYCESLSSQNAWYFFLFFRSSQCTIHTN